MHCLSLQIKSWLPDCDPVVITYFCNLSIKPLPKHLLSSLCYQIAGRYRDRAVSSEQNHSGPDDPSSSTECRDNSSECVSTFNPGPPHEPTNTEHVSDYDKNLKSPCLDPSGIVRPDICLSELKECLSSLLSIMPSTKQPLFLILDGLDHIENSFGSQIIGSLPSPLPPSVKVILAVSSNRTQVLRAINPLGPPHGTSEGSGKSGCVCALLGGPDRKQCVTMLTSLLSSFGRKVTSGQQVLVNQALTSCCLPLYARLLHLHTSLWHSGMTNIINKLTDSERMKLVLF